MSSDCYGWILEKENVILKGVVRTPNFIFKIIIVWELCNAVKIKKMEMLTTRFWDSLWYKNWESVINLGKRGVFISVNHRNLIHDYKGFVTSKTPNVCLH